MIRKFLFGIDLFGISVPINFSGKEKSNSKLGGTCSLIFFCFIGWAMYNSSNSLFNKKEPTIFSFEASTEDPKEILLSPESFPVGIEIQAPSKFRYKPFINESIYKLQIFHNLLERVKYLNGTVEEKWTSRELSIERCTSEHFGSLASSFNNLDLSSIYCMAKNQPNHEKVSVRGVHESPIYQSLTIFVLECDNSTSEIGCASKDTLNTYLEGARFNLLYANVAINLQNFSSPTARYKDSYKTTISVGYTKTTTIELSKVGVTTDSGWLVHEEDIQNFTKVNKITEGFHVEVNPEKMLMACTLEASKVEIYHSRSYKKIQSVLAEVGGLANALFVIFLVTITPYLKFKVQESLMNELFDVSLIPKVPKARSKSCTFKSLPTEKNNDSNSDDMESQCSNKKVVYRKEKSKLTQLMRQLSASSAFLNRPKIGSQTVTDQAFLNWATQIRQNDTRKESQKTTVSNNKYLQNAFHLESSSVDFLEKQDTINYNPATNQEKSVSIVPTLIEEFSTPSNSQNSVIKVNHHIIELSKKILLKKNSNDQKELIAQGSLSKSESIQDSLPKYNRKDRPENSKKGSFSERLTSIKTKIKRMDNLAKINTRAVKTKLNLWEYICSFVYQSDELKKKLELMNKGIKNIDQRLDVVNILKKLRELDKLKVLLLDHEQLLLFNNMPKPEIFPVTNASGARRLSFSRETLKRLTFVQGPTTEAQLFTSLENIKDRNPKTNVDERLIEIFEEFDF